MMFNDVQDVLSVMKDFNSDLLKFQLELDECTNSYQSLAKRIAIDEQVEKNSIDNFGFGLFSVFGIAMYDAR